MVRALLGLFVPLAILLGAVALLSIHPFVGIALVIVAFISQFTANKLVAGVFF